MVWKKNAHYFASKCAFCVGVREKCAKNAQKCALFLFETIFRCEEKAQKCAF